MIMQIDVSAGLSTGTNNFTYEIFNADADGARPIGPLFILLPAPGINTWGLNTSYDADTTTEYYYSAYAASSHCFVYTPVAGEEFNLLVNSAGTADLSAGQMLIVDDTSGTLLATTGSPETEPFMLVSAVVGDLGTDVLAHVIYTGY
jgi:hypothetical protein